MSAKKSPIDEPGCLDRLSEYAQGEITGDLASVICGIKKKNDCQADECDDCPARGPMVQLEYDIQTEAIQFIKGLIKEWAAGSVEK